MSRQGFCLMCGCWTSPQWILWKEEWNEFQKFAFRPNKKKQVCKSCYQGVLKGLKKNEPIVKPSHNNLGKGLYAEKDYEAGELVTTYEGNVLSPEDVRKMDTSYMYKPKQGLIIDGKFNFGSSKGRYINCAPKGEENNVTWGKLIGNKVNIRAKRKIMKAEEFYINYGSQYFNKKKKK